MPLRTLLAALLSLLLVWPDGAVAVSANSRPTGKTLSGKGAQVHPPVRGTAAPVHRKAAAKAHATGAHKLRLKPGAKAGAKVRSPAVAKATRQRKAVSSTAVGIRKPQRHPEGAGVKVARRPTKSASARKAPKPQLHKRSHTALKAGQAVKARHGVARP